MPEPVTVKVMGASDDLIEIECREIPGLDQEHQAYAPTLVAFDDGTVLHVAFYTGWEIHQVSTGPDTTVMIERRWMDEDDFDETATLLGPLRSVTLTETEPWVVVEDPNVEAPY